jgi:hypothetical protein
MEQRKAAKPPLKAKHVWAIRTKLQIEGRARDLATFNLAIDSKATRLRGVNLRSRMLLHTERPSIVRRCFRRGPDS